MRTAAPFTGERIRTMYKHLLVGMIMVGSPACSATIEQLQPTSGGPVGPSAGRAFFLHRGTSSSEVLVCDAKSGAVYCYSSNTAPAPTTTSTGGAP